MRAHYTWSPELEDWYIDGYYLLSPSFHGWLWKHLVGKRHGSGWDGRLTPRHYLPRAAMVGKGSCLFRTVNVDQDLGHYSEALSLRFDRQKFPDRGTTQAERNALLEGWGEIATRAWHRRNPTVWTVPLEPGGWFEPPEDVGEILRVEARGGQVEIHGVPKSVTVAS